MGDEQLQREEDERYRKIDRVIDKADADASDAHSDDQDQDRDRKKRPGSGSAE
jgi:hypothetical protein